MIKISALNEESSEESEEEDVPTITKEAQEQIALTEYNKALELLKENEKEKALNIFKDLLETELLDQIEKPEIPEGRSNPMLSLKYSCYKNIAAIQTQLENYDDAINNYWEAANLDDTDVMLWYRLGTLGMKTYNLELACLSFKQGLKCNPNHWPCLDNIITSLYAVPDYMNCLLYISMALERDSSYTKGLAFRDRIFKDIPCLEECYKLYNYDWALDPPIDTEYDRVIGEKYLMEAKEVASKWSEISKPEFRVQPLPEVSLRKPLNKYSWFELGESLVDMHRYITENNLCFVSKIKLNVGDKSNDVEHDEAVDNEITIISKKDEDLDETLKAEVEVHQISVHESEEHVFANNLDTAMEVEVEDDKKSAVSDIQIIEEDDTLRIVAPDSSVQLDDGIRGKDSVSEENVNNRNELQTDHKFVEDLTLNEKSNDKYSDKMNDKTNEKSVKAEGKEEVQKVKKRRRSTVCFLQEWAWSSNSMRRSARVRSSNRKEAERDDVQLEETLRRIFPSHLLPDSVKLTKDDPAKGMDDSMDTMDLYQLFANQENNRNVGEGCKSSESSKSPTPDQRNDLKDSHLNFNCSHSDAYFNTEQEKLDVESFITEHSGKSNLMVIIAKYTEFLCTKWNVEWPTGMVELYLQAYSFTREHIPHPSPYDEKIDECILKLDSEMTLLFGELHTDRWISNKPDVLPASTLDKLSTGLPSEELGHIIFTSARQDLFNEDNSTFLLRLLWLKAGIFLCQGDTDIVIETLELLLQHMQELQEQNRTVDIKLPNCKYNCHINIRLVEKKLTSILRGQKLGEIQTLYDDKKYAELAAILQDTFKFAKQRHKYMLNSEVRVHRINQLAMLLDSLWQLQNYEDCFVWAEACLNEAWQNYLNTSDDAEQKRWAASILNCLNKIDACTAEASTFILKYLPESRLSRLVQNLVHMVCHQLDVSENTVEMPLETVLPWILLHYILQYEEDKDRAKTKSTYKKMQGSNHSESEDEDDGIPASVMLLFTAHEFIGRHSWCCINEAKLLFFIMNAVIPKLETPQYSPIRRKLTKYLEQVFYCLYGHPNSSRKGKPKHIEEHGVPNMELTWEGAQLLFDFYRPTEIPDFQSPRAASITSDTESLFKRIIQLVPPESDPNYVAADMMAYITREEDTMPTVKKPLPYHISSIFYLLGDFYFKNNKWTCASKYYLLDLCLHSTSLNSWTGIAMATGTTIESWLNNYENIKEDKFLKKAQIVQSCYHQAIKLEPSHSVIWTEYGNFVYMVHSYCSRLLKQESDTLSMERFEILETRKEEMLDLASDCFLSANQIFIACHGIDESSKIHDERWLYQYMLGKVAEKKNQDPPVYLDHYAKASDLLYENNAQYPDKISHKSPQNLSIEALEVHYRIHASILKYLEQHEGKPLKKSLGELFQWHLKNCAEGPFMKYQPKLNDRKKEDGYEAENKAKDLENHVEPSRIGTVERRSNSVEEIEIIDNRSVKKNDVRQKIESRKRSPDCTIEGNVKRLKLGNVSHLQLMQDVVALIDDLITRVCEGAQQKESSGDEVVVLSSDESDELRPQKVKGNVPKTGKTVTQSQMEETLKLNPELKKSENIQDLMDVLMKQTMEMNQETEQSLQDDDDTRKYDGKWLESSDLQLQTKEAKEKLETQSDEKKKTEGPVGKEEITMSRRGSQESTTTTQTTTTTTETNNSSSTSSDDSSSSDDSWDSDSSSSSDSESVDSDTEKRKKDEFVEKEEFMSDEEVSTLITYCLAGLEQCILRFAEHHKSLYRLTHFFFNNKTAKDNAKCRELLLGIYHCQYYAGQQFQGLFYERRNTNFFNGIWHIPNREIDRPGSFASHMSKCVTLLMQVLKETNDSYTLMKLCVQLRKIPDADKKYLRDTEREQLARQALTLCLQSLRTRVQSMAPGSCLGTLRTDGKTLVLLDVYKIYRQVQKHFQGKDQTIQSFTSLLCDTYKTYVGNKDLEGNVLELAVKYCQRHISANKNSNSNSQSSNPVQTPPFTSTPMVTVTTVPSIPTSPSSQFAQQRKPYKTVNTTGRPRGRPPNINKHLQGNAMGPYNQKSTYATYMGSGNRSLIDPYYMSTLGDQNMLSKMIASSLGATMMDQVAAFTYLSHVSNYQDILRQYQNHANLNNIAGTLNNATPMPNISNISTMSTNSTPATNLSNVGNKMANLTVQQLLNLSNSTASTSRTMPMYNQATTKPVTTTSTTKEKPSISITPVTTVAANKAKATKINTHEAASSHLQKPQGNLNIVPGSKPVMHSPTQISLLKPSIQSVKPAIPSKTVTAPQIRVSKSLTEPQPAHNSPLSHSPLKSPNTSPVVIPQVAHTSLGPALTAHKATIPVSLTPPSHSGTTLQHKLLSKKQPQRPQIQAMPNVARKSKAVKSLTNLPGTYAGLLPSTPVLQQPSFIPPELSGISVRPVTSQPLPKDSNSKGFRKQPVKQKPLEIPQNKSADAFSVLSQLQQHSHLEIIPQQKSQMKQSLDFSKNVASTSNVAPSKMNDPLRTDSVSFYEVPRAKITSGPSKKPDKSLKDNVEIITLDD